MPVLPARLKIPHLTAYQSLSEVWKMACCVGTLSLIICFSPTIISEVSQRLCINPAPSVCFAGACIKLGGAPGPSISEFCVYTTPSTTLSPKACELSPGRIFKCPVKC